MELTERNLKEIRDMCFDYYADEVSNIRSIILYGGAARNFFGHDHTPRDFDLNIFFSNQSGVSSTYGMPKIIGEYGGLEVEVMRNRVPERMSIRQYVEAQDSKRWNRIREEPIVQIHPEVKRVDWM